MFIHDLDVLRRDEKQSNLYDLTAKTFTLFTTNFSEHTVMPDEDMRIDLICFNLYRNVDFVDILMNLNGILNPLSVRTGDRLIYPEATSLTSFRVVPSVPPLERPTFINQSKANIKDPRRLQFVENNFQLPPTMLSTPQSPIRVNRDEIVISQIR